MTGSMPSVTQVSLALTLVALFAGCWIVLRRAVASLAVVLPMIFLAPWRSTVAFAESTHVFPLSVALVWVFWLYLYSPSSKPRAFERLIPLAIVSLVATAMVAVGPQAWIVLAVLAAYAALKPLTARRFILPLSLLLLPIAFRLLVWVPQAVALGKLSWLSFWWDAWFVSDWSQMGYYDGMVPKHVLEIRQGLDAFFWLPLLFAFLAAAWEFHSEWWFRPTMLWAGTLFAGALFFGRDTVFQHSSPLQMALLIPFGIAAVRKIRLVFPSSFL